MYMGLTSEGTEITVTENTKKIPVLDHSTIV